MRKGIFRGLCTLSLLFSMTAYADHGDNSGNQNNNSSTDNGGVLSVSIIGSQPSTPVAGVASGGAPWVVREGKASLSSSGKLHVEVQGLLIGALWECLQRSQARLARCAW